MFFDMTYVILVLPAVLFSLWASANVKNTFAKYSSRGNASGITGAQAARRVLDENGIGFIEIKLTDGELSDCYDPKNEVIYLSADVYNNTSPAALGVACHEVGHAIQHSEHYFPLEIRNSIVTVTNIGSKLSMPLVLIGLLLCSMAPKMVTIAYAGLICFALCALFQLITLPVEFNASSRAKESLRESGMLNDEDLACAGKVLNAAALTYVAALAVTFMQLLRLYMIVRGSDRRD